MRRPSRTGLSCLFVLIVQVPLAAQNIEAIGREKPFSFSGGLSFNQVYYASRGIAARREPYNFFATGNINASLYGWTIPLTFSITNRKTAFAQPFNQYAIHPTWKWIKAHAGYVSMSLSPYTVNGHIFRGLGVDLDPGTHWRVSALYGRFLKASEADTLNVTLPVFMRHGAAIRTRYENDENFLELILFHALDDISSISMPHDTLRVLPQQNLVASIGGGKTLFKHFVLKGEIATSALTRDTRAERSDGTHLLAKIPVLFPSRVSTSYYKAFKTSFDYQHDIWMLGVGYERIDPGYQTLGAYYFNNDLENITVNGTARALQDKFTIALSAGLQKDNVDRTKISTMQRVVSACNVNYMPSKTLNVSGSWSSFRTFTNIRSQFETLNELTPYDNLDTLNFTQISRNATASITYAFGSSESRRQNVTLNVSRQKSADTQGERQQAAATSFFNMNAGYSVSWSPQHMSASLTYIVSLHQGPLMKMRMSGPTATLTRSFLNRKLRTTLAASWNKTQGSTGKVSSLINARLNSAWAIRDKHSLALSGVVVRRTHAESPSAPVVELTVTAGYQYSFSKRGDSAHRKNNNPHP